MEFCETFSEVLYYWQTLHLRPELGGLKMIMNEEDMIR